MNKVIRFGIVGLVLASAAQVQACECPLYLSDDDMVRSEIVSLKRYDVALDGFVVEASSGPKSVTTIQSKRIWFGPPQKEFLVKKTHMCTPTFFRGTNVRVALTRLPDNDTGFWARLISWFKPRPTLYEASSCSFFSAAMSHRSMREAVQKRGRHRVR